MSELDPIVFEFDRYIKGVKMAQGVTIERERDLPSAMRRAATLASRGLNGEVPVLVLRSTVSPLSDGDGWQGMENAPHDMSILVAVIPVRGEPYVVEAHYDPAEGGSWWMLNNDPTDAWGGSLPAPTHWRPLPAAPRDGVAHE